MLTARRESTTTTFENIYVANENLREYQSLRQRHDCQLGEFIMLLLIYHLRNLQNIFPKYEKEHSITKKSH